MTEVTLALISQENPLPKKKAPNATCNSNSNLRYYVAPTF